MHLGVNRVHATFTYVIRPTEQTNAGLQTFRGHFEWRPRTRTEDPRRRTRTWH